MNNSMSKVQNFRKIASSVKEIVNEAAISVNAIATEAAELRAKEATKAAGIVQGAAIKAALVVEEAAEAIERIQEDVINARQRLEMSEKRYRRLFETAQDGILILNADTGQIDDVNPFLAKMLGYSREEFIEKKIWDIGFLKDIVANKDKFLELQENEFVRYKDLPLKTKTGKKLDVEFVSNVYLVNSNKVIQCNIRDITETKEAEHQLLLVNEELKKSKIIADNANAAKSNFLSNMSHEIRTPMNAIIGMASLLSETSLDEKQAKYVEIFQNAGFNLLHIIDDILDISKIESNNVKIQKSEFNLKILVKEIFDLLNVKAEQKKLALSYAFMDNLPSWFLGDDFRIKQILTNLIGNSIKFTNTGGIEVWIGRNSDTSKKGNLLFVVTDSGIGVTEEQIKLLFHSFAQADSSTTKLYGGTGLGLSISKKLVELMGGEIWIESNIDNGATVSFTLDCIEIDEQNRKTDDGSNVVKKRETLKNNKTRILIVDDAEFNRMLIQEYLKDTNYIFTEAENGKIAVDKIKREEFDVVLMDMQMPVLDGYTATQEIRAWEKETHHPHIPIVAVTAYALKEEQEKSLAVGCDQHLSKPILKKNLVEVLERVNY